MSQVGRAVRTPAAQRNDRIGASRPRPRVPPRSLHRTIAAARGCSPGPPFPAPKAADPGPGGFPQSDGEVLIVKKPSLGRVDAIDRAWPEAQTRFRVIVAAERKRRLLRRGTVERSAGRTPTRGGRCRRYRRLFAPDGRRRGGNACSAQGVPARADRPGDRPAPRPHRQDHRRRLLGRVFQPGRGGALGSSRSSQG